MEASQSCSFDGKRKEEPLFSGAKRSKLSIGEQVNKFKEDKQKFRFLAMDAYSRHKLLVNEYLLSYSGATAKLKRDTTRDKTDLDVLKEHSKFIWDEDEEPSTWEQRLAKKYYDKLYKEYCITDLTFYRENKIAMRWRTEKEVVEGKGQFTCGQKKCTEKDNLRTWEVNFAYVEDGTKKNALVKLRLCPSCSEKLNFHHKRKEVKPRRSKKRKNETLVEDDSGTNTKETSESCVAVKTEPSEETNNAEESSSNIWSKAVPEQADVEKPVDEEFDDYLAELFL